MAEDVVIRAEGLGKKYVIGHQAVDQQATLRDAISHGLASFARTTRDLLRGKPIIFGDEIEEFWALREVSFQIRPNADSNEGSAGLPFSTKRWAEGEWHHVVWT